MNEDNLRFRGAQFHDVWQQLLDAIVQHGDRHPSPRGKPIAELTGVSLRLDDLRQNVLVHPHREGLNYRFMLAEFFWIALGRNDLATLARFNRLMTQFSDDNLILAGAYGPRLHGQWKWALEKLRRDPNTRQAVCSIWTPTPEESKDIPCTLSFQYLLRENKLNCIATMRSSDVWLGLPYDMFTFSMLAAGLAGELGVPPGWLQLNLGSSHLYLEHEAAARRVLNNSKEGSTLRSPYLPHLPRQEMACVFEPIPILHGLMNPWFGYQKALSRSTSRGCLEVLRTLSTQP